jgi:hypothetical protein
MPLRQMPRRLDRLQRQPASSQADRGRLMRIRSIKPEFYRSEDIAALNRDERLVFIGLWSYVDDNGVGRDSERLVVADLFPFDDFAETLASVSRALQTLFTQGLITRYNVENRPYLYVNTWDKHQKIDRPNKARYPLPTCGNATIRETLATPSRVLRTDVASGAVEQRNRGTEEQEELPSSTPSASKVSEPDPWIFTEFWENYPRKVGKEAARKSWRTAIRKASPDLILAAAVRYKNDPNLPPENFIPHPSTWLTAGRWLDGPLPSRVVEPPQRRSTTDIRVEEGMNLTRRLAAQEAAEDRKQIGA